MARTFNYHALLGEGNPLLKYPRLQEAAIDEFALKSFEEASLNEILKQADMSKGSLYHHFGDKFGLYLAMMDIIVNKKLSYFYPILRQNAEDTSDFFAMLKEIMKGTLEFMLEDERLHHLFNRVMEEREDFRSRVYSFFPMDYAGNFSEFVRQAVQSGQIDTRYPPDFVAKVVEIMFANIHKLVSVGDPNELLNIATQVVDMIQYGISR